MGTYRRVGLGTWPSPGVGMGTCPTSKTPMWESLCIAHFVLQDGLNVCDAAITLGCIMWELCSSRSECLNVCPGIVRIRPLTMIYKKSQIRRFIEIIDAFGLWKHFNKEKCSAIRPIAERYEYTSQKWRCIRISADKRLHWEQGRLASLELLKINKGKATRNT